MNLSRLIRGLSEIYVPGGSTYRVSPGYIIGIILVTSIVLYFIDALMLLVTYALSVLVLLFLRGYRIVFKVFLYSMLFLTPYIVSAVFVQLYMCSDDPSIIVVSCLRMQILVYISVITVSLLDTVSVVRFFSRLSPSLGFLLAMTLKAIYVSLLCGTRVLEIYSVNFGKVNSVKRLLSVASASANLSLYSMFYIMEAFYTRRHIILGRGLHERNGS